MVIKPFRTKEHYGKAILCILTKSVAAGPTYGWTIGHWTSPLLWRCEDAFEKGQNDPGEIRQERFLSGEIGGKRENGNIDLKSYESQTRRFY